MSVPRGGWNIVAAREAQNPKANVRQCLEAKVVDRGITFFLPLPRAL
jgi:hypothetical protein